MGHTGTEQLIAREQARQASASVETAQQLRSRIKAQYARTHNHQALAARVSAPRPLNPVDLEDRVHPSAPVTTTESSSINDSTLTANSRQTASGRIIGDGDGPLARVPCSAAPSAPRSVAASTSTSAPERWHPVSSSTTLLRNQTVDSALLRPAHAWSCLSSGCSSAPHPLHADGKHAATAKQAPDPYCSNSDTRHPLPSPEALRQQRALSWAEFAARCEWEMEGGEIEVGGFDSVGRGQGGGRGTRTSFFMTQLASGH